MGLAIGAGDRVGPNATVALGVLEDRGQHEHVRVVRAGLRVPLEDEVGAVVVDRLGRDRADRHTPPPLSAAWSRIARGAAYDRDRTVA